MCVTVDQHSFISKVHKEIWPKFKALYESGPTPTPHDFEPGDWVLVKQHRRDTLKLLWKGPYMVILTTPTAIKVGGISTWIHHTHAQKDYRPCLNGEQLKTLKIS